MLFSARLPLSSLIELCRTLRHNLGAGLTLQAVFRQMAQRGTPHVRPVAGRISQQLEQGQSLEAALKGEQAVFPQLFLALANVGEEAGMLPEVFGELEKYYLLQQRLRRQFLGQIAWPVFELLAAIFVIALMLWAMGIVADITGKQVLDPLGIGLTGASGALIFLGMAFGSLAALAGVYLLLMRSVRRGAIVHGFLLQIPALGPCLYALAVGRFCLALRLTLETGMSVVTALRLSLQATGNSAFEAKADTVVERVRVGDDLTVALSSSRLFGIDFINIIANAEESGELDKVLRHQADYYEEEAERRMRILTFTLGKLIWVLVAVLIIFVIFRVFTKVYLGAIEEGLKQ
jgi:type IV pilus assembly protein PilC